MPDYSKGKIYKLWSPSKNLVYYGSTTQTLAQRLQDHKRKNCSSYLIMECEDYKIELLEEYPCNNREQLEKKEGEYIKANECVNKCVAGRNNKEYHQDKKTEISIRKKEYYQNNKEKKAEYDKKKYLKNKTKILLQKKEHYQLKKNNNIAKD